MSLTIHIHPVAITGTDRSEQFRRAQDIAKDLRSIDGVKNAECIEPLQKTGVIYNRVDPIITVALIGAASTTINAIVSEIFKLLREKRDKKDHREDMIFIGNLTFQVTKRNDTKTEAEVKRQIEQHFKKRKK